MKVYEVRRDGITMLLMGDDSPKEGDEVLREFIVDPIEDSDVEVHCDDGDYVLHLENGEITLRRLDEVS